MTIFNTVIPILIHFSVFTVYHFPPTASVLSNVKSDVTQSKATFHINVRFATEYRTISCRKFLTLSERRFTEFPALSINPRVGISWSASETYDYLFFLPITGKVKAFKRIFIVTLYDGQLQTSFGGFSLQHVKKFVNN